MKKVSCVSDLHLFCRRSNAQDYFEQIDQSIQQSDIFIFNGDTFDFRWSIYNSVEETVEAAIDWLRAIVSKHPHCQFYFILGNHDTVVQFVDALKQLESELDNLEMQEYFVRLGTSLFLHGDVANRKMTAQDLENYRTSWQHEEQRGETRNRMYDWAFKMGVHKAVAKTAFPTIRTLNRIQHYLNDIDHGEGSDITHVYFGHTHIVIDNVEHNGQVFYNGGAPMSGLNFNVLQTTVHV